MAFTSSLERSKYHPGSKNRNLGSRKKRLIIKKKLQNIVINCFEGLKVLTQEPYGQ
jgi:hypothetical protein